MYYITSVPIQIFIHLVLNFYFVLIIIIYLLFIDTNLIQEAWLTDYCVRQFSAIKPECNVLHVRNWVPFKCFNKSNCLFRGEKKTKKKKPKWNITLKWANKPQNTSSSRKSFDKSQNFRQKKGKRKKKS